MSHPLHIAFLSEHASPTAALGGQDAGGQNVYVDELSRQLGALGHRVDIFTRASGSSPTKEPLAPGVRLIGLPVGPPGPLAKDQLWLRMPEFLDALTRFVERDGARYDLAHGNFWMSGWAAMRLRQQLGLPAVQIFHALGKTKQRFQGADDTSPLGRIAVELDVVRQADRLIAQCPSERGELIRDYAASPDKIALIPAAVNIQRFRPVARDEARRRLGLPLDDFLIVYVGRVLPRKDIGNLVAGLARLRSLMREQGRAFGERSPGAPAQPRLLVVGGETAEPDPIATPEIGALQALAEQLGVADLVQFAGKRQPDQLRDYYGAADVAATTPWYEPFGLTPLEAMACGRPVVGSAVGGLTYTIQDGLTGALVPPRDPDALALRLYQLYVHPELRAEIGHAARARVEREFTWPLVAQRTAALYQALLEEQQPLRELAVGAPIHW
jgi:glycosyltransferase involved in cell wall biosynthesis